MKKLIRVIPVFLILTLLLSIFSGASAAVTPQSLRMPAYNLTECEWNEAGMLVSETVHDMEGNPAINNRGFHKAIYTWDTMGNPLTETYTGINGELVVADGGYAKVVYAYENNSKGVPHIVTEDRYDADGNRADITGSYSYRRDIWDGDQIFSTSFYDADGNLTQPTGGYARIVYSLEEDENAIVITKRYEDENGKPLLGSEGGAKVVYTYAKGLTAAINAKVDNMGLGMLLPSGAREDAFARNDAETRRNQILNPETNKEDYERMPMLISTEIFGTENSKTLGAQRWHQEVRSYDERGNLTRTDYYDADGEKMISGHGYASMINTYDEQDRVIQIDYLDRNGELIKMLNGFARVTYEYYDNSEKVHFLRYFGADGERTMITTGVSMIEYEYNGGEWDYRETFYDILDEYTMANEGYARIEKKYESTVDFAGNGKNNWKIDPDLTKWEKYYGTDMNLIERKAGHAGYENYRNEFGQIIRTVYKDDQWLPTRFDEGHYATIEFAYEGTSLEEPAVYEAYFDKDGNPVEGITGAYARSMVYGGPKKNLLLEEAFYDAEGNPDTSVVTGAHKATYTYDRNLLQTSVHYYNADGTLSATRNGEAAMLREYNSKGNLLWEVTFGDDNMPMAVNGTNAAQVHSYDYAGHHTGEKFFDENGTPVTNSNGYASAIYEYDAKGNIISISYYNAENMPTLVSGRAKVEREYDNAHHMTYELNIGTNGRPVLQSDGFAARKLTYDPEIGLTSKVEYLDAQGEPVVISQGYASYEVKYDHAGNLTLRAYYDEKGELTAPANPGYAKLERQIDARGRVIEEARYNADGSLQENRDGYAVTTTTYETNKTTIAYLNANREPAETSFGYAEKVTETDYMGNTVSVAYFGAKNEPVKIADGYHIQKNTWDMEGHQLSEKYFDENGNPATCPKGYASFICEYDKNGNTIREVYFGVNGEVAKVIAGAPEVLREYDDENRLLSEKYLDETGMPYMLRGDYAATECEYDARGNLLTEKFFGTEGQPVISTKGYAQKTDTYDIRGHLLSEEYSDGKGNLLAIS